MPLVCVDQGHDDTDLRQAQPKRHKLGPIVHQQTDHIALLIATLLEGVGNAVRQVVYLAKTPFLALINDARLLRVLGHIVVEQVPNGDVFALATPNQRQ